jgi:hypothetical protein
MNLSLVFFILIFLMDWDTGWGGVRPVVEWFCRLLKFSVREENHPLCPVSPGRTAVAVLFLCLVILVLGYYNTHSF